MKILREDDPLLGIEDGIIFYKRKRDSPSSYSLYGKRVPQTLIKILTILEYISSHYEGKRFIQRCEAPALSRIIRNEIFEGELDPHMARAYAYFLGELIKYSGKVF